MGFRPESTTYNLTFDGTPLEGLQVKATCCTVADYRRLLQIASREGGITEEAVRENDWVLQLFADNLVSWNLDDPKTGQPVPTTKEGLDTQEQRFVVMMISAWQTALISVPTSSGTGSDSGGTSAEASLGLASSSQSLQN